MSKQIKGTPIELLLDLEEIGINGGNNYQPQSLDTAFKPQYVNGNLPEQMNKENGDRQDQSKTIMSSRIRQSSNMARAMNAGVDPRIYDMGMDVNMSMNGEYELGPRARMNISPPSSPPPYPQNRTVPSNTNYFPYTIESYEDPKKLTCIDVANHIQNCPICSRFYENDKSIYIVIIIILIIVCGILLKKLIDCHK